SVRPEPGSNSPLMLYNPRRVKMIQAEPNNQQKILIVVVNQRNINHPRNQQPATMKSQAHAGSSRRGIGIDF
ncbi:hypothetical protein, partial [Intrasporangium sp. YIM S08009]|uniref:hypothetical protein n=1 Tax=Intrasporangium zincisolvens TaxID=3080018 RepID=UPI002B05C06E